MTNYFVTNGNDHQSDSLLPLSSSWRGKLGLSKFVTCLSFGLYYRILSQKLVRVCVSSPNAHRKSEITQV